MLLREPEVRDHRPPPAQEDVGELQVAVQELLLRHLHEAPDDVLRQPQHFRLGQPALLLQEGAQVALVAVLRQDVAVRGLPDHLEALEDVGVLQTRQRLDFAL